MLNHPLKLAKKEINGFSSLNLFKTFLSILLKGAKICIYYDSV